MERETLETESLYHATNESYMYAAILTMATGLYPIDHLLWRRAHTL